ncbi:hypothetical protein [Ketobacter sp.]|uniref:hypothetical protein n=1 Tax=Ketobacter sp. TaxID=2083498 RepID=UPI000F2D2638|nr:hypothetical protein [Ketobacter sp.]RLT93819.1 MAG: hypothetical protein D9N14_17985 [Ketobacter sp.]
MKPLLLLPLLLITTSVFAESLTEAELDTRAMDARLAAGLEAEVEAKIRSLNSVALQAPTTGSTTVERPSVDSGALVKR